MEIKIGKGRTYSEKELEIINSKDFLFKCNRCNTLKSNENFYKLKRKGIRGRMYTPFCRNCRTNCEREKQSTYNSSEHRRKLMIKRDFGLEYEDYLKLHTQQNSCCAICGIAEKDLTTRAKRLAVDHCHVTNKNRGLLCSYCNIAIGLLKDNIEILQKAIEYLKTHQEITENAN